MAVDDALIGINLETFQFFRSVHGPVGIIPVDNRDGLGRAPVPVRTGVGFILGKFGSVVDQPQGVRFGLLRAILIENAQFIDLFDAVQLAVLIQVGQRIRRHVVAPGGHQAGHRVVVEKGLNDNPDAVRHQQHQVHAILEDLGIGGIDAFRQDKHALPAAVEDNDGGFFAGFRCRCPVILVVRIRHSIPRRHIPPTAAATGRI